MRVLFVALAMLSGCASGPIQKIKTGPGVSTEKNFVGCAIYVKAKSELFLLTMEDCAAMATDENQPMRNFP